MALPYHGDVEWDRDEMHQLYRNRGGLKAAPSRLLGPQVRLDPIAPELVGCANLTKILESRSRVIGAWGSAVDALAGRGVLVGERTLDEEQLRREASLFVSTEDTFCRRFFVELTTQSGLLVPHAGHPTVMHCGMFGVEKTEELLRVIFDARNANLRLQPLDTSLVLFTLDQLATEWARAGAAGDVYVINADYRHYYYQLKIPPWLIPYVVVNIGGKLFHPAVLPMGYRDACNMAQCVTWCIVLHREFVGKASEGRLEDSLGVPDEIVQGAVMPPYIPLRGGGAIFVLLDGVFIMNTTPARHHQWRRRLERNEALFSIRRKIGHSYKLTATGLEDVPVQTSKNQMQDGKPRTQPLPPLLSTGPEAERVAAQKARDAAGTFAGVTFESRERLRPAKPMAASPAGTLTLRGVASRLGRLLWHLRVLGAGRGTTQNEFSLLQREDLLDLWSKVGKLAASGWSTRFEGPLDVLTAAEDELRGRRAEWQQVARPPCQTCIHTARYYAVDATPTAVASYEFGWDGERMLPLQSKCRAIPKTSQAEAELQAALEVISETARSGAPCPRCGAPPLAVVGGDADAPRAALNKGYSCSRRFRELMRPVFALAVRPYVVRIPGKDNAGDGPSRGREVTAEEMAATQRILRVAALALAVSAEEEKA